MLKSLNEYLIYKHSIYIYIYIYDLNNNILIYHFRCCLQISQRHKRIFKIKFKIVFNIVLRQESEMRKLTNAHF